MQEAGGDTSRDRVGAQERQDLSAADDSMLLGREPGNLDLRGLG
jgi:hypothetical protein